MSGTRWLLARAMEIKPWSPRERSDGRERGREFFEISGSCREKSKEMGESGVMWIDDVAL